MEASIIMMNIFDIGIILLFVLFIIIGFKNGVIKECVSLIGIILVFIISFSLKGILGNLLCTFLPFFSFTGAIHGLITINILMYQVIAFMIVFSVLLGIYAIVLKISKFLQKIVNLTIILWLPSKLLGAVVSFVKGYIVLFAVFLVLMIPMKNQPIFYESSLVNMILYKTPILSTSTNSFTAAIGEVYDLGNKVSKNKLSTNEANLQTLDVMLKYNIVDKSTIERLVKMHKLDNISRIDSVLNNY